MDPRRGLQHEYDRSRGGDGGGYGIRPSSGRAIPPTAIPSLSTGQGFYTVESLEGATMVPPPQPAPPPPRLLPPPEPYARDFTPPHPSERLFPGERRDFSPFDRRHAPPPSSSRKMMMPPPDMPLSHRGEGMRGHGMLHHHPPPPFMGDPRMPGFFPRRREPRYGWGPSGDFDRYWSDRGQARSRPPQRLGSRAQFQRTAKPGYQAKSPSKSAAADKKSPADKQSTGEGGPGWCSVCKIDCLKADSLKKHVAGKRHKKQMESEMQVENPGEKAEETKMEREGNTVATVEGAEKLVNTKENEVGKVTADKAGDLSHDPPQKMVIEREGESEATESAGTSKPAPPVVGKKRAIKVAAQPKKKIRKSTASSDASKLTAAKGDGDSLDASKGLETSAQGAQVEGADQAPPIPKILANVSKNAKELGVSTEEPPKGGEDGSREVREVTDLANGKAGQSAEYQ